VKKDKRQWMPKRRAPNVQSVNTKMASIPWPIGVVVHANMAMVLSHPSKCTVVVGRRSLDLSSRGN
jgi:hypothetical protein